MMIKHVPQGPLARYVQSMWYRPALGVDQTGMLLLPSGRNELVISLDGSRQRIWQGAVASLAAHHTHGPATLRLLRAEPYVAAASGRTPALGVSFRAHGLRAFIRTTLSEHADKEVALDDLWGAQVPGCIERLALAPTPADKFSLLEEFLLQCLQPDLAGSRHMEQATFWLSDPFTERSIASVADAVDMRPRRFAQLFREYTGLTPKVFARVMRFRTAAHRMRRCGESRWTDVAALCNYYDQAHMVRDFHALAGMNPGAYLKHRGGHATCLPWAVDWVS